MHRTRSQGGQTIAEYVLIIAIVVVAAIGILGVFSDTVRAKLGAATVMIGGDQASVDKVLKPGAQILTDLKKDGTGT